MPPKTEWIGLKEAARIVGLSRQSLGRARKYGRIDAEGQRRRLRTWRTMGHGIVTTRAECELFLNYMNGWK